MVKEASKRIDKYAAKIDPDAIRIRFDKGGQLMKDNQAEVQGALYAAQAKVREILNSAGISSAFTMPYQAAAMELLGLQNRFSDKTYALEAKLALDKWSGRGCEEEPLVAIAAYFGIEWEAPPE